MLLTTHSLYSLNATIEGDEKAFMPTIMSYLQANIRIVLRYGFI